MSFVEVEHTNPNGVIRRLERWSLIQRENLVMKTVNEGLDALYETIYRVTPVRTGYMRSTLQVRGNGRDSAAIFFTAYYSAWVEQGTHGRRGRHFFLPSVAGASIEIINAVRTLYGL